MRLVKLINWDNVKAVVKKATADYKEAMETPPKISAKGQKIKEFVACECRNHNKLELLGLFSIMLEENLNDAPHRVPALVMVVPLRNMYPDSKKKHGYALNKPVLSDGTFGIRETGSVGNNFLPPDLNVMRPATDAEIDQWFNTYDFETHFDNVYRLIQNTGCPY